MGLQDWTKIQKNLREILTEEELLNLIIIEKEKERQRQEQQPELRLPLPVPRYEQYEEPSEEEAERGVIVIEL